MNKKEQAYGIFTKLSEVFPEAGCELGFGSVFELLVAVILSAQCTDRQVNKVTGGLFKVYNRPEQFAQINPEELIKYIRPCGYYNSKAAAIISASRDICERFGGEVPSDLERLMTLRGVGRKTASVVSAVGFGGEAIAVDTHVFRVGNRTGIAPGKNPLQVENGLRAAFNPSDYGRAHHLLLFHGRYHCKARKPACESCVIKDCCESYPIN